MHSSSESMSQINGVISNVNMNHTLVYAQKDQRITSSYSDECEGIFMKILKNNVIILI